MALVRQEYAGSRNAWAADTGLSALLGGRFAHFDTLFLNRATALEISSNPQGHWPHSNTPDYDRVPWQRTSPHRLVPRAVFGHPLAATALPRY